jgi:hypothetical protein
VAKVGAPDFMPLNEPFWPVKGRFPEENCRFWVWKKRFPKKTRENLEKPKIPG